MRVPIKTKLRTGMLFLFAVILVTCILGCVFVYRLSGESKLIIKDNYETIVYVRQMTEACDRIAMHPGDTAALGMFHRSFAQQQKNITEPGEQEITESAGRLFGMLEQDTGTARIGHLPYIRNTLHQLESINLEAIRRKNDRAARTAHDAIVWMTVLGCIAILLSFSLVVNFPGYIANPIRELTEGIKEIAARNYSKRLHFRSGDEFGELAEAFNSMTGKLEEYESSNLARLLFEKKRIDTVISSMRDAIIGLDENGVVLFMNPVATELLGLRPGAAVGQKAETVAAANDLLRALIAPAGEAAAKTPLRIIVDGREAYFTRDVLDVTAVPTGEKEARRIGSVIVLKNITQFRELDLAKTNFIATVSHELKTPIASIKMSLSLLEDQRIGTLNEEQEKLVDYIRGESNRLLGITGELLDMAQVETGRITLDIQPVAVPEIIAYAERAIAAQAQEKNIRIEKQLGDALPLVAADAEKSAWVLINLLSNALRYAPEHSTVRIAATRVQPGVQVAVHDEGKGIPAAYQSKIFEKYFRAPGVKTEGTGLGLAIAKEFIESQKGIIGVSSAPESGTTFWFVLPAADAVSGGQEV